ncbi:hypothetical protein LZ554_006102 [Drepanopeziza brunnea f. sp. 'monogermtubi']|nr:hypothetical protein LZ554_006102 [Drepanopeziza brunnea f. sp. 'monogermtubi']
MAENHLQTLVKALRDHDLTYDREALKSASEDPESQTAIREWIEEHLCPETVLSRDEANLYATLIKSGEAEALAAQDLSLVQDLNDEEIHNAIEELKRSTAAIEKHTEVLRLQQNAFHALVKSETRTAQARTHTERGQLRKWEAEKASITAAIEELSQSLVYQISDLEQQGKTHEARLRMSVDGILRSDDKLLLSLEKLSGDLEHGSEGKEADVGRIRELCAMLIKHTVEGIRTRLDRVYMEGLRGSDPSNGHHEEQVVNELQEELESLYSEVLPVAQMSAEQQFLEPALKAVAAIDGKGQERTVKAIKYIHDCMIFLVNRIETFLQRAEESQCHRMALQVVIDSVKQELAHPSTPLSNTMGSPTRPNATRSRNSSASQANFRLRNSRRSSGAYDEEVAPEQQLARNLGVALPAHDLSDHERASLLERMVSERTSRLEGHADSLQSTTEQSISSHLLDAKMTMQLLRNALLSNSQYGKVRLIDLDLDNAVTTFEGDVQALQDSLEAVNLHNLQARNVHRDQLVERWSR